MSTENLSQIAQWALDEARSSGYTAIDLIDALHVISKRRRPTVENAVDDR
jgi:hypothetical protein